MSFIREKGDGSFRKAQVFSCLFLVCATNAWNDGCNASTKAFFAKGRSMGMSVERGLNRVSVRVCFVAETSIKVIGTETKKFILMSTNPCLSNGNSVRHLSLVERVDHVTTWV